MLGFRVPFVDPVDTDNLLMCLEVLKKALKSHPDTVTPIVLSPRAVDHKAKPYGANLEKFQKEVGPYKMRAALAEDPEWAKDLDDEMQPYFYRDADFSDLHVREDVYPYMILTAFRFASFFERQGIPRSSYVFYWDESSLDKIGVGIRHAIHVPDYSYDFNAAELRKFEVARDAATGEERRKELLAVCDEYVKRQVKLFGYSDPNTILHDFDELIELKKASVFSSILTVGGPLTEALRFAEELPVSDICLMGFFINGITNLFPIQYNILLDPVSAKVLLMLAIKRLISLLIIPTEGVKASPYQLTPKELKEVFGPAPWIYAMVERFTAESNTLKNVILYDWVAALVQSNLSLLPVRRVEWYLDEQDGVEIIKFRESSKGWIWMCWNDHDYMESHKGELMRLMKSTVTVYQQ